MQVTDVHFTVEDIDGKERLLYSNDLPEAILTSEGREPSPMVLQEERRPENKEFSPVDRLEEGPEAIFTSEGREPSPMVWREERRPGTKEFSPVDRLEKGPEAIFTSEGKEPSPMVWLEERRPGNKELSPVDRLEEEPEASFSIVEFEEKGRKVICSSLESLTAELRRSPHKW